MSEAIPNFKQKTVEEFLLYLNDPGMHPPNSTQFQLAKLAIEAKTTTSLTNSIDELRKSNDESSRAMKRWTIVLAGATIVLAIATIILALK